MNRNPWLSYVFYPLAVGVMMGCVGYAFANLVRPFYYGEWNTTYVIVACVAVAVEAHYSYRLVQAGELSDGQKRGFMIAELALLAILIRFARYMGRSWDDVLWELRWWPRYPLVILDPEFIVVLLLAIAAWYISLITAQELERAGEPIEPHRDYIPPIQRLTTHFYWGGGILLFTAGVAETIHIGLYGIGLGQPLRVAVWVYFLTGLIVLSYVQFATMSRRWEAARIVVGRRFAARWMRLGLTLIAVAALIALLLPSGEALDRRGVVGLAGGLLLRLINLVPTDFLELKPIGFSPIEESPTPEPEAPPSGEMVPLQDIVPAVVRVPDTLRVTLFWVFLAVLVGYVLYSYLRDRPELVEAIRRTKLAGRIGRALGELWAAFLEWLTGWKDALSERFPRRKRAARRLLQVSPLRFFRLGALSPRERVRYYYLSILHRAKERGIPRQRAQTPYEYALTLKPSVPEAGQEIDALTQAFVEARYSRQTVEPEQESRIRAVWQRVRAALRELKQGAGKAQQREGGQDE